MMILALDTTTAAGSCAIVEGDRVLREAASDGSMPQASRLPGELGAILDSAGVRLADVDAFAVGVGPGSFTGLRVGIAAMQGLAFASARPLVGVSALDALAHVAYQNGSSPVVCTWVDAWRGEVYAATYEDRTARDAPVVARPEQLLRDLDRHGGVVFTGDGAMAHRQTIRDAMGTRARFTDPVAPLLAGTMGRLAVEAVRRGERPAPHAIRPLYVRRPDAELARAAKADHTIPAGQPRG